MLKSRVENYLLIFFVMLLATMGLVFIYSASCYNSAVNYNDSFYFVKKQLVGLVVGIVALIILSKINYEIYHRFKWHILGISFLLLILVFIPSISVNARGANRWISIGGFSIQASEVAKFGFVIFAASYMSKNFTKMNTLKGMLPVIVSGGSICLLVLLEPNLSVTLCIGMVMLLMLLIGGSNLKWFVLILIPALLLVPFLIIIEPYRFQRLVAFIDPWANPLEEGYQLIQSLYSLGTGGLFGIGLFNSRQKYLFLPFSESDFIFSIIGEEVGLFGCFIILFIFIVIITLGFRIAMRAKDRFGCYLSFGIVAVISCQLLINLCVVTGLIPPTGIPLPFVSAGGSSLVVFLGAVGILLNVSKMSRSDVVAKQGVLNFEIGNIFKRSKKVEG